MEEIEPRLEQLPRAMQEFPENQKRLIFIMDGVYAGAFPVT
jgi:hypothetical protein